MQLKLFSVGNRKAYISVFSSKYRLFNSGGQRGIRILETHRFRLFIAKNILRME